MKIAGIQADLIWEDPQANYKRLAIPIAKAAGAGARMVALPEMFPTGFSMDAERIAEDADGPSSQFLLKQAQKNKVVMIGGVATRQSGGGKPQNQALVAFPDGRLERFAKIHPFTFAQEDRHYAAGDTPLIVEVDGVRVAVAICYDLRFGEYFAALAEHTDCFVIIANWPEARREHWQVLLQARSIESVCYVLGVNRVGSGGNLKYTGDSRLFAPMGVLLGEVAPGEEGIVMGEVDAAHVAETRARFPVLADRRVEVYRRGFFT